MAAKKKVDDAVVIEQGVEPVQFSKEQILASKKYHNNRDLVDALLEKDKKYTMEQVEELVNSYKKGQVK